MPSTSTERDPSAPESRLQELIGSHCHAYACISLEDRRSQETQTHPVTRTKSIWKNMKELRCPTLYLLHTCLVPNQLLEQQQRTQFVFITHTFRLEDSASAYDSISSKTKLIGLKGSWPTTLQLFLARWRHRLANLLASFDIISLDETWWVHFGQTGRPKHAPSSTCAKVSVATGRPSASNMVSWTLVFFIWNFGDLNGFNMI